MYYISFGDSQIHSASEKYRNRIEIWVTEKKGELEG